MSCPPVIKVYGCPVQVCHSMLQGFTRHQNLCLFLRTTPWPEANQETSLRASQSPNSWSLSLLRPETHFSMWSRRHPLLESHLISQEAPGSESPSQPVLQILTQEVGMGQWCRMAVACPWRG